MVDLLQFLGEWNKPFYGAWTRETSDKNITSVGFQKWMVPESYQGNSWAFPKRFNSHPHDSLTKRNQPSRNTVYTWLVVDLPTPSEKWWKTDRTIVFITINPRISTKRNTGWWLTYPTVYQNPSEKWWKTRQLGLFHSQLFLESHSIHSMVPVTNQNNLQATSRAECCDQLDQFEGWTSTISLILCQVVKPQSSVSRLFFLLWKNFARHFVGV